jgi:hypothetical protein
MSFHKVTEFRTEWFNVCTSITSKVCTNVLCKSFAKQNNDLKTF